MDGVGLTRYKSVFKFLLLIRPYWRKIISFVFSSLVLTLLSLPLPWLTKILIDDVMLRQNTGLLYLILFSIFGLTALRSLLAALRDYHVAYVQNEMAYDIKMQFLGRLHELSFSFFDSRQAAKILSRLRDASLSRHKLIDILVTLINNLVYLSIVPVIVLLMNWRLTLLAGITLPWMTFTFFVVSRVINRYTLQKSRKQAELSACKLEYLDGIREIIALRVAEKFLRKIKRVLLTYRQVDMKLTVLHTAVGFSSTIVTAMGTLIYTWYGAGLVISGQMSVGELIAFTTFVGYLYTPLTTTVGLLVPIQEVIVHTNRFYEIFDSKPQIDHRVPKAGRCPSAHILQGEIEFRNVSFGYDNGAHLKHISFRIARGQTVAIVGTSGSGKSSIVQLIPRFYDPYDGKILIDGLDVRQIPLGVLRDQIGVVMQSPFLFVGSVYENITCGQKGYSRAQVLCAARAAAAHRFISGLPSGYATIIGEKGHNLSGGEYQRIALARILLRNRPILILDEATSCVDLETDCRIHTRLKELMAHRTTLIVTHRLERARTADKIMVVSSGRLVESGRHDALLARKGTYFHYHLSARKEELASIEA